MLNVGDITNKDDVKSQLGLVDDEAQMAELAALLKQIENDLLANEKADV